MNLIDLAMVTGVFSIASLLVFYILPLKVLVNPAMYAHPTDWWRVNRGVTFILKAHCLSPLARRLKFSVYLFAILSFFCVGFYVYSSGCLDSKGGGNRCVFESKLLS